MNLNWKIGIVGILVLTAAVLAVSTSTNPLEVAKTALDSMVTDRNEKSERTAAAAEAALSQQPPEATGDIEDISAALQQELSAESLAAEEAEYDADLSVSDQEEINNLINAYDGTQF